jgi:hypothetical protein
MKNLSVLLCWLLVVTGTQAQSKNEKAVAAAMERLRLAMISADSVKLADLVSDQLSYGHSGGHVDDKTEFISKITSGKSDFVGIEFTDQTISVNRNVAVIRHKMNALTNDGGKPGEVHLLVLLVWQKLHGYWKLLARQAVKPQ